jgi:hypothetical protein
MTTKPSDLSDVAAGWAMTQTEPPVIPEDSEAWGTIWQSLEPQETFEVAGLGGPLGRIMGRSMAKTVKPRPVTSADEASLTLMRILGRVPSAEGEQLPPLDITRRAREATIEDGRVVVTEQPQPPIRGESGEINITRHAPGASAQDLDDLAKIAEKDPMRIMRTINNAEDLGIILDKLGETMHDKPRTQRMIARAASFETLYTGVKAGGLLNDKQLFSLRSLVATLGDQAIDMAHKISAGDQTPQLLAEYQLVGQNLIALTRYMKGQVRETARALAQQRMIATTLDNQDINALEAALRSSEGGQEALVQNAKALALKIAKGMNNGQAISESMNSRTGLEAALDFWKANNLSSFATQTANAGSSIAVSLYELGRKGLAAGIGEARTLFGASDAYRAAEYGETLVGATTGLYHSVSVFFKTLLTGEADLGSRAGKGEQAGAIHQFLERQGAGWSPNLTELVATPAFRVMQAADEAIMYPTYMAELSGLAAREGIKRGLKGEDLRKFIDDQIIHTEPPDAWREQALEAARRVVMQQREPASLGLFSRIGEYAYGFTQAYPIFGFAAPWIRTPARIFDYAVESTVLNAINPKLYKQLASGGPEADIAASKIITAFGTGALVYSMIDSGALTGAGPENPEQRAALEKLGWQQYSVRVNGKYYSYKNWGDPLVGVYAGVATAFERARLAREPADVTREAVTAVFSSAEYMLDSSYLEGMKRILESGEDSSGAALAKIMGATATGFVPYASLNASIARAFDDAERAKSRVVTPGFSGEGYVHDLMNSVKEDFKLRIPGWRDTARPRRYWDGEVMVPEQGTIVTLLTPVKIRSGKNDLASAELVKHGVAVSEPRSRIQALPGVEIDLIDLDDGQGLIYDEHIKLTGEMRREAVDKVVNHDKYRSLVLPGDQEKLLVNALQAGSERALSETRKKVLKGEAQGNYRLNLKRFNRQEIDVEPFIGFQPVEK